MIAEDLINQLLPPLRHLDSIDKALNWMEEFRVKELPIVENKEYKGMINEEMLYDCNQPEAIIGDIPPQFEEAFVYNNQHLYEVFRKAEENKLDIVPVLNSETNEFLGAISLAETLQGFSKSLALQSQGGIVVLAMNFRDYSLAQISRLVEENNAKVLSAFVEEDEKSPERIRLTLKLNTDDINSIIATFERFEFEIIAQFKGIEDDEDWNRDRVNFFFRFLDL